MRRDLLDRGRLQVQQDRFGARLPQIVALFGTADDARHLKTTRGEQALQPQRDLSMTSSDDNAHASDRTPERPHSPHEMGGVSAL
ncbi:hypothetical protein SSP24_25120 [Streptomyces spinoverrucosus]|uniref:Uncharacterized protein n=1 Tax=Streptomyces spinoverrucosus TaxID=284043 RepID=A0A4Y3VD49_9ACTN|nr:hypothetical protein SSP24_25120 [Streptomyces spinoverrucosus]GHB60194.1 hypothetical protein GCM10010397_32960 [Streptomyces spinoverrucosus]